VKYLLDTCVISELTRTHPSKAVIRWISARNEDHFFLSVLTLGELIKGIDRLPSGSKKMLLQGWLDRDVRKRFAGRILPIDPEVAEAWGFLCARTEQIGKPIPAVDGLIAATAVAYGLTVVTRNTKDMDSSGVPLLNPWQEDGV
jgi:predicted nucleic acid-binding protein